MPNTERVNFPGHDGLMLSGRLELPDTQALCTATFSHCFTCTKDTLAAYRISKRLARMGIATLRFDFAGLGDSEGEFAKTNFSTTCDDLRGAIEYLNGHYDMPRILIGHSLGGTTSLAVGAQLDGIDIIVTIASPSQPDHVLHHFGPALEELEAGRATRFSVADQSYGIEPQFITDIRSHDLSVPLSVTEKQILIFDVVDDAIVEHHNAEELNHWAGSVSTLIELEDTDHLVADTQAVDRITKEVVDRFSNL